jgi:hypothetical protein
MNDNTNNTATNNNIILKPCPWCGGEAHVERTGIILKKYSVVCDCALGCPVLPCTWKYDKEKEAIDNWNSMNEYRK